MKNIFAIIAILALSACACPQQSGQTMAQKCNASPSCKAALEKLGKDVQ